MDGKSGKVPPDVAPALLHKKMLQLLSSLWVTRAVGTFARLGLADVMEEGVEDHAAIAAARGLVPGSGLSAAARALDRRHRQRRPRADASRSRRSARLLSAHAPNNTRTTAIFLNDYFADMWSHLDDALTGERTAFEALKGRPFFDWLGEQPDEARRFNRMMLEVHGPETPAIVAAYDFSQCRAHRRCRRRQRRRCCRPCSPPIRTSARRCSTWRRPSPPPSAGRAVRLPGVTFVAGDVFETAAPEGGDLYLIRHLMHDYDDRGLRSNSRAMCAVRCGRRPRAGAGGAAAVR